MPNLFGSQNEPIQTRELVRSQAPFDSLTITKKQPPSYKGWTAEELMKLSDDQYAQLLWAIGDGLEIWKLMHESGFSRECPPCPARKE
jgi:hypothetical protein